MCTIILFGAPWDGHFKMFASTYRHWHELAILLDKVQDVELAYYEYTGQSNGSRSIPSELHLNPTLGSYEWHGYQSGKRLWHNGRECWSSGWDVNCIMKLCLSEIVLNPDNLDLWWVLLRFWDKCFWFPTLLNSVFIVGGPYNSFAHTTVSKTIALFAKEI